MILNTTISTTRRGVGTILQNFRAHKTVDKIVDRPEGRVLTCMLLAPVKPTKPDFQPGDFVSVVGSTTQSAYIVEHVEDRSGAVIPELRMLLRGTMQVQ